MINLLFVHKSNAFRAFEFRLHVLSRPFLSPLFISFSSPRRIFKRTRSKFVKNPVLSEESV